MSENRCCVCGHTTNDLDTYISILTKEPRAYCFNCILSGFEPYEDLVNFGWEFGQFSKTFQQKSLLPTLALNSKSVKQFNEDVIKKRDEKSASI